MWKGDDNIWDVANPSNPAWLNGTTPDFFLNGDCVTFDDSGSNDPAITISGPVAPASIFMNNNTKDYTFIGTGKITGSTDLIKSGDGTMVLANDGGNDYTGKTVITAGKLQLSGGDNRLPTTGDILITGGVLDLGANNQTTSGAVRFMGGTVQNGAIVKSENDYDGQSGTISAVLDGAVGLTKSTDSTLTLTCNNTYTGTTTIKAGTLALASTGSISASTLITVNSGATFDVTAAGIALASGQTLAGTGTVLGNVADTSSGGATIVPGGVRTAGTLTFSTGSTLGLVNGSGNVLKFDIAQNPSSTSDLIVADIFDARNSNKIDINISLLQSTIAPGYYSLIRYGTLYGTLADNLTLSGVSYTRQTFSLQNTGSEIDLYVVVLPLP